MGCVALKLWISGVPSYPARAPPDLVSKLCLLKAWGHGHARCLAPQEVPCGGDGQELPGGFNATPGVPYERRRTVALKRVSASGGGQPALRRRTAICGRRWLASQPGVSPRRVPRSRFFNTQAQAQSFIVALKRIIKKHGSAPVDGDCEPLARLKAYYNSGAQVEWRAFKGLPGSNVN